MRTAFIETLCEIAAADERVWLLTGDLGFSVVERFRERFPERFVNGGIAEQNLMGLAAGLASCGAVPFVYSIANFPTLRCLEQVRNDICYHQLNVKIVAVGCGLAYGGHGYTHHGVEDLGVMALMPHMTVLAPGDPVEARWATRTLVEHPGPAYLRLGKAGEPIVHKHEPEIELGKAVEVVDGTQATLISTGGMLDTAVKAAAVLSARGASVRVLSMPTLRPLDERRIVAEANRTGCIVTLEEHGPGGLGTMTGECLAEAGLGTRFLPLRLLPEPTLCAGSQAYLCGQHGLTLDRIVETIAALVKQEDFFILAPAERRETNGIPAAV
jgi:transketolase